MSQDQSGADTRPTSTGNLFLRGVLVVALIVAGIVGGVWYANR